MRTKRTIKYGMVGSMESRTDTMKQYKKSKLVLRRIGNLSRKRTRCYIVLPRNPACATKPRTSRISGKKLLRRVATLPVMIRTLILASQK